MKKVERRPRPITDGYVRQTLRQMGFAKEDITPRLKELQRVHLEGMREIRKVERMIKGRS